MVRISDFPSAFEDPIEDKREFNLKKRSLGRVLRGVFTKKALWVYNPATPFLFWLQSQMIKKDIYIFLKTQFRKGKTW